MTHEGDALLRTIQQHVRRTVDPQYQEAVTQIVAHTVVTIMADPQFYNRLGIVMQLQHENALLRQHLANAQTMLQRFAPAMRTKPVKKAAPKKAAAKKAAPTRRRMGI